MIWILIIGFLIFCFVYYAVSMAKSAVKKSMKGEKLNEEEHDGIAYLILIVVIIISAIYEFLIK